jgi:SAM-dependent methyltransferase
MIPKSYPSNVDERIYTDNGFSSFACMENAHAPMKSSAVELLSECIDPKSILDLGCGNGWLLKSICEQMRNVQPIGVESTPSRCESARRLLAQFSGGGVETADIFENLQIWERDRISVVILMIGRLLEVPYDRAQKLVSNIGRRADHIILYAYSGYPEQGDNWIESTASKFGISVASQKCYQSVAICTASRPTSD